MSIILFILVLVVLILVHEFGHFIVAKIANIRVDEFAIGFPPRLFGVRVGETLYSINLFPLGGFVRIYGETDDAQAQQAERSFVHAPRLVQALVAVGGIAGNFVAAWILISAVFMIGMPAIVGGTASDVRDAHVTVINTIPDAPAAQAGVKVGDIVTSLQTGTIFSTTTSAATARDFIGAHGGESIIITVNRAGEAHTYLTMPKAGVIASEPERKAIGVEFADVGTVHYAAPRAFLEGAKLTYAETSATAVALANFFGGLFTGHPNLASVSGPVGIAQAGASAAQEGWGTLLWFAAIISINLALINILPVPGLDGGRLFVIVIEAVRRKSLPSRFHAHISLIGFSLLAVLMVLVTWHDIAKMF